MSAEYTQMLGDLAANHSDALGYIAVINGRVVGGEVYSSAAMFRSAWGRLLRASAIEAIAQLQSPPRTTPTTDEDVRRELSKVEHGKPATRRIGTTTVVMKYETDEAILFETQDVRSQGWVKRTYLMK